MEEFIGFGLVSLVVLGLFLGMKKIFNRPLRVCGLVKNIGAPGGGPFWVQNGNTPPTLQIVEISQIDSNNQDHQAIVESATHFNPVDLVCGLKNYKGQKFDLSKFFKIKRIANIITMINHKHIKISNPPARHAS